MSSHLEVYLTDHLAGSRFAIGLLDDLAKQSHSHEAAQLAASLLPEIKTDREELERILAECGSTTSSMKELSAWIAQKTGRLKFSLNDRFGIFEAVEFLSLGILGKRALWRALQGLAPAERGTWGHDFEHLVRRADEQHKRVETLRLQLAAETLDRQ